jgi:class 3 adenylate cyclase/predicted ATPase
MKRPIAQSAITDVAAWLRSLGLERFEPMFREHAIEPDVLHDLTEDHLREMGLPLGARLKLLKAIGANSARTEPENAERRQVTVLFSDLVGSTALSTSMDPEDLRDVITAYQTCVAATVHRLDGFVAKYLGDGVLAYFGYPQAHEDDPERAVLAGLELTAAVAALSTRVPLKARVGIATGTVVVGDLIGSGEAQERGIVGETPNLAARLQAIATPDTVVIAEGTRRLLGNLFELADLGAKDLKGIGRPVRAWAVLRACSPESRFEAMHAARLTELVGRQEEFDLLWRRWSRAKAGEGQVVLLSGEAGIGKSRLTAALLERLGGEPYARLRSFCSPQHTDSTLYPIIAHVERAAGLTREDTTQVKLDKLDSVLAQTSTSREHAALIAEMLSLPNDGRYPSLDELTPQQRRQQTFEALIAQVETLARHDPVMMIFEDAHWADPTSLEAFDRLVDRIRTRRVLLIVTFRPEFESPWIGRPHVTALTLNRLVERDIDVMIDRLLGGKELPPSIRKDIVERADGIPLFVEEMTRAVLEAEDAGATVAAITAVRSLPLAVPASLQASLLPRLDRLGPAKEIAQVGAAIGRDFSHAVLADVVARPQPELEAALGRLIAAGLLFRQGVPPNVSYVFKHALVQDAAYGTLLREPKRALHARIAEAIESRFAGIAESQPELLARHCTAGGLIEKAARYWGKAGQRSLARSALIEAVEQLTRALDQIAALPPTTALRREEIRLQVALITPLMYVKGYAAPETRTAAEQARLLIEQAEELGEPPEDPLLLFSVLFSFWVANYVAFNGDVIRPLAEEFFARAEKEAASVPKMIGHQVMGVTLLHTGSIVKARTHLERALALYNPTEHRPLTPRFPQDTEVSVLSYRARALWLLGHPQAALADIDRALGSARKLEHPATLMFALAVNALVVIHCGDYATAAAQAGEVVAMAQEKGTLYWKALGTLWQGWLAVLTGNAAAAAETITSGLAAFRSIGATLFAPVSLTYLARAHAELGQPDEAWRCIGEAMATIETTKETWCQAEVCRMAGEIALMAPASDAANAESHFERALAVARAQQARSWELRAVTSLARLWRDRGRRDAARGLLAPVYGWFHEGLDTRDLKEASALLDTLGS